MFNSVADIWLLLCCLGGVMEHDKHTQKKRGATVVRWKLRCGNNACGGEQEIKTGNGWRASAKVVTGDLRKAVVILTRNPQRERETEREEKGRKMWMQL
jgi:hypothetical protein